MAEPVDFEAAARALLPESSYHYFAGGAGRESTLADNRAAFERLRIVPRVLRGAVGRSLATTVLGADVAAPVLVAPIAYQATAHPDGELALARGAADAGVAMCLSSLSNHSLEDVAAAAPSAPRFFQLYPYRDRALTEEVVARAAAAGYRALMVTVDVAVHGRREREMRYRFSLPDGCGLPCVPVPAEHRGPVAPADVSSWMRPDLGWPDIESFIGMSELPVVLKGVLSCADAEIAADLGVAGVVVSNHGGRQLDTAIASIDALAPIAERVGDRVELLVDGGVRHGVDVLKALALGARAVLIGRPVVWGLAVAGADGVRRVVERLCRETEEALALAGCAVVEHVDADLLHRGPA